ncbi:trypsin-like serine protease [Bdellovibrio sp. SKB1291214]|uniref:S1 family peptidase n=1 Tax=Bdellovibrio sp. SKB1291214 TaxID=1732569 RepID=UPI000B519DC2|nr:trypsin-like serine protease [Bdellovibrio sp. SKB1291214]UYL09589.1 trypsin-like serine protease [Bdellovibrio sp. SKB1291214]
MRAIGFILVLILAAACSKQAPQTYSAPDLHSKGTIIGGEAVKSDDFARAATVSIYTVGRRGPLEFLCTGTLISRDLVVTAAHCLQSVYTVIYVSFGEKIPTSTVGLIRVDGSISHPNYRVVQKPGDDGGLYWTTEHDIALMNLDALAPEGFNPVGVHANTDKIPLKSKLLLAGFGITDDEASTAATSMNQIEVELHSLVGEFLVIDQSNKKGACFGDSGGPAYLKTASGWLVVGATHAARPGFVDCHHMSDYTSLSKYIEFIKSSADTLGAEAPEFILPETLQKRPPRTQLAVQ